MDFFTIEGGTPLKGSIKISGSKNAVLPILSATLLTRDSCVIENVPDLKDVHTMCKLLVHLGAKVKFSRNRLTVNASKLITSEAPYELVRTMRASVLVMGPLLARLGKMRVSLPGGCAIGARPIDIHLNAFKTLGVKTTLSEGYVEGKAGRTRSRKVVLSFPSVGATENVMMYATGLGGTTIIENAAREPEIIDLAGFLNSAGSKITGAGSNIIRIVGTGPLRGTTYRTISDRIEAGTYAIAAAITRGDLCLTDVDHRLLKSVLDKLESAGVRVDRSPTKIRIRAKNRIKAFSVSTKVYPGFPTDIQPQIMALMSLASGKSVIQEKIFENRFTHVAEFRRMGADITVNDRNATIRGVDNLKGADVMASDLRAGAALVIAGLSASGQTRVNRIYHVDRGYEQMEKKLRQVGAKIRRLSTKRRKKKVRSK